MTNERNQARVIFLEAIEYPPEQRAAFLDGACGGDPELRARVERLLRSHQELGSFHEVHANPAVTLDQPITEKPGAQIGPYKLLQEIGQGGMGVVYMAEQTEPVRRKVALKIIKPGMDTRQVIARFEAERQALSLMDHPNIARVLDAGTTGTGRPYFVMELVKGQPLTEYCDQQHLTPRQRIELFVPVCQAIQHAHQKGIIHRDIKPSNVLIAEYDGRPVAKVIDFGVAKATSQPLTEKTMFTGLGQIVGTLEYMSPEQARVNQLDIDTRSDVYSLGVLLYELLTGSPPLDKQRLRSAAWDEMLRMIREEEPPRPSTRLSESKDSLPSISAQRQTEPAKLTRLVRGELDWIVMKALEKDRNRRYETANGFAADLQRYLSDEQVQACPPSAAYRFQKFARRNKASLMTAAMLAAVLVAGMVGTSWQAMRAMQQADRAGKAEQLAENRYRDEKAARADEKQQRQIAEQQKNRAEDALAEVEKQKQRAEANFEKARHAVDEYLTQVTESELLTVPGLQPLREDLLEAALTFYDEFTKERNDEPALQRDLASAHFRLGLISRELGKQEESNQANAEATRLYEQLRQTEPSDQDLQVSLARAYFVDRRFDDTVKLCKEVLLAEAGHVEARNLLADAYNDLANADYEKAAFAAALEQNRQAFELREGLVRDAPENPRYLAQLGGTLNNIANLLLKQGKLEEALPMFERAVDYTRQAHEREPHSVLWGKWICIQLRNLANSQANLGRQSDALSSYQQLVSVSRKRAFDNPAIASLRGELSWSLRELAQYQQKTGDTTAAARSFREVREILENMPHETAEQLYDLATVYAALAQPLKDVAPPSQEQSVEQERNIALALEALQKAVEAGYVNVRTMKAEKLFDVMRDRDDFQELVETLEKADQAQQLASRNAQSPAQELADNQQAAQLLNEIGGDQPGAQRHRAMLATTLQSIGVIQTGLKQFADAEKSFGQALELRDELRTSQRAEPEPEVEWLGARIALANLYWSSQRFPQAHQIYQECSRRLLQIALSARDNAKLQQRIAGHERSIGDAYAGYGLWPLAREYAVRNIQFQRIGGQAKDAEYAALLLTTPEAAVADEYLAALGKQLEGAEATSPWAITHLVRIASISHSTALTSSDLIDRSRKAQAAQKDFPWFRYVLATALYGAGEIAEARDIMRTLGELGQADPTPFTFWQKSYLEALIASAAGEQADARSLFAHAERQYDAIGLQIMSRSPAIGSGLPQPDWNELAYFQALRREACRLIRPGEPFSDPWQRLIQARGYRLIGELEKADEELEAAVADASKDTTFWMARANLLSLWNDPKRPAEPDWRRAVELAGDDPLPWILRGRWYAERGQQEKADVDFAKAASLTPNELNKFLEVGWWVVGPYPPDLREFCPPELDPDPSRPVHIVDPKTGLSDQTVKWRSVPTGLGGRVELASSPVWRENASVYAMVHVYSPMEQTKLLMIPRTESLRVWVNGELIENYAPGEYPVQPHYEPFHRAPVVLRAGRNVILVKSQTADFTLRIGDTPRDRAHLLAEQERFTEAHAAMTAAESANPRAANTLQSGELVALLGTDEEFAQACRSFLAQAQSGDISARFIAAYFCAHRPNPVFDEHAAALAGYADEYLAQQQADWALIYAALVHYRAENIDRLLQLLSQRQLGVYTLPLQALLAHQAGDQPVAAKLLDESFAIAAEYGESLAAHNRDEFHGKKHFVWWYDFAAYLTTLREAEQTIRGETTGADAIRVRCESAATQKWGDSPETIAFDQAILFGSVDGAGQAKFPQPYLARGRRLAEVGRIDEAASDFDKAVKLAPNDPNVLAARAVFLADSGQPDKAAADFNAALNLLDQSAEKPRWHWGVPIDLAVADRDDVFERLVALRPQDARPLMTRMAVRMERGDVVGSRSDADRLASYSFPLILPHWRSAEALWRGDHDAALAIRASATRATSTHFNIMNFGVAPTEEPMTGELLREADRMWQEGPQHLWNRRWLGLAQLRGAQYDEAITTLEASLAPGERWQKDGLVWALLAIAHHHLGNEDEARRWLDQTARWFDLRRQAESRRPGCATGVADLIPEELIYTLPVYREARALIDGPEAADAERDRLAAHARERTSSDDRAKSRHPPD